MITVENLPHDIYDSKFLYDIKFNPQTLRGKIVGILGRLKYEKSIADDENRFTEKLPFYKSGVTYSERTEFLNILLDIFSDYNTYDEIKKLSLAIEEELYSAA